MAKGNFQRRELRADDQLEVLLTEYYGQLRSWAATLSPNDAGRAEEIVQELCLYFAVARPDLSQVKNLEGYLYTSLRHVYLSSLARASREAVHRVELANCDSLELALASGRSGDPLVDQNELRRVCGYAAWRKESAKSASYFILHFFHGYTRAEIASIARLPLSAIYNKLKTARSEVKIYLEEQGKVHIFRQDAPPQPALAWDVASSAELFLELRTHILRSRSSACLAREELLANFSPAQPRPIPCALLAHIVSCEDCLAAIDHHFRRPTLKDREPLDGFASTGGGGDTKTSREGSRALLREVERQRQNVQEHRPQILSIAANGFIIASHDIQAERSTLAARLEQPDKVLFIEAFSEQGFRLALLSLGAPPPHGSETQVQLVPFSDGRWLELRLEFDGLGLRTEATYFDPSLRTEAVEDEADFKLEQPFLQGRVSPFTLRFLSVWARLLDGLRLTSAPAWAFALGVLCCSAGYLLLHHRVAPESARGVLNAAVQHEAASLKGQTEHQTVEIEELSADGTMLEHGVIDQWKDGDGQRYLRRFYDAQHKLVAVAWRDRNGAHEQREQASQDPLLTSNVWAFDNTAQAFRSLGGTQREARTSAGGWKIGTEGPFAAQPELRTATLVLNRQLRPVQEELRISHGAKLYEVRFVERAYEYKPSPSMPDSTFEPESSTLRGLRKSAVRQRLSAFPGLADEQSAELQVAVLYTLNKLGADTADPIQVARNAGGVVQVSGVVTDPGRRATIVAALRALASSDRLELHIGSPGVARQLQQRGRRALLGAGTGRTPVGVYDFGDASPAAESAIEHRLSAQQPAAEPSSSAVKAFSQAALQHAQVALQNAFALHRLATSLSSEELASLSLSAQQEWAYMADEHARALTHELHALQEQLTELSPPFAAEKQPAAAEIKTPTELRETAARLLEATQVLNREVGDLFANTAAQRLDLGTALKSTLEELPLADSNAVSSFAQRLRATSGQAATRKQADGSAASERP